MRRSADQPLLTAGRFADAIARLAARRWSSPAAPSLRAEGVSLATVHRERDTVARLFVADLAADRWPEEPGREFWIQQGGKERRLYQFPLMELVIHDAVAHWLAERVTPSLSPALYSYQPERAYYGALQAFAAYVRKSGRTARRLPGSGIHVVRRDVQSYFDSIPIHDGAPVWPRLEGVVGGVDAPTWRLLHRTLRPALRDAQGTVYRQERGIPTGSPVANVIANMYLTAMDRELSMVEGGFYARYGDDFIAAHHDHVVAADMSAALANHLTCNALEYNPAKANDYCLTANGMRCGSCDADATSTVEFLGHAVSAAGTVSLSGRKTRALLDALRARCSNATRHAVATVQRRLAAAAQAANDVLDPGSVAAHPAAQLLRHTVTDRAYLKWLDHEVATIVVAAALGRASARNFRHHPPREMRSRFRLRSLVTARNRCGRGGGDG